MKPNTGTPPALDKPPQPGGIRAVVLAVLVHAAFFALIVFGVTWQSSPTAPVQAEIWDKLPPAETKSAPPKPQPPPPEPVKPEPPKPEPAKPEPPKPEVKPPDTAIAEKVEREKKLREKREREEAQRDKAEREKAEKQKRERLEKQQEEDARRKREQDELAKRKREDEKRKRDEDAAKKAVEQAREAALAARRSEVDGWVERIKSKIRGRANVPDTVSGKPSVQVRIRILPGGEVLDIAVTRSSGNRVYDTAIERAIRSASPLPVPEAQSELFPQFRDLILNIEHDR